MTAHLTFRAFVSAALLLSAAAAGAATPLNLRFIGQQLIASNATFGGTRIGGLSGIEYDPATTNYFAISDDRSDFQPARFYSFDLQLTAAAFTGVTPVAVTTIRQPNGLPFPQTQIDPESIRLTSNGNLLYTSEGDVVPALQSPFIREMKQDGSYVRDFIIPAKYQPTADGSSGIRDNLAFESLTFVPGGATAYTAVENALFQDGPAGSLANGSNVRILRFDAATGQPNAEFVYRTDPVARVPNPADSFTTAGLVELLALSATDFIAVERSFSNGGGNTIKLFQFSLDGATNVFASNSLNGLAYMPITKTLLLDLATLNIPLDNIEGITLGETLNNGSRSLILVSDNNFTDTQPSQFLAFEITAVPEPASWAMMIGGFLLVGARARRNRGIRSVTA